MATQTRTLPGVAATARRSEGVWRDAFGRLRKNKLALLGAFGVFLLAAVVLERQGAARSHTRLDLRWLGAAVGSLAAAFAVWNTAKTGSPLCWPHSIYQGHGVWHLLCALSAWCLFRLYVSEAPLESAEPAPTLAARR